MNFSIRRFLSKQARKKRYHDVEKEFILDHDAFQDLGKNLGGEGFTGGPLHLFSAAGRLNLITLLKVGLMPDSRVLDIGCGALRGGYWLIHFLDKGCYHGIEPAREMLQRGRDELLTPGILEQKEPHFDTNTEFDFSVFGCDFQFFLARSIWTHASKDQIRKMLDGVRQFGAPGAKMLASYYRPYARSQDYRGQDWVGISHESGDEGIVHHSLAWIEEECNDRGLTVRELPFDRMNNQIWLLIRRT